MNERVMAAPHLSKSCWVGRRAAGVVGGGGGPPQATARALRLLGRTGGSGNVFRFVRKNQKGCKNLAASSRLRSLDTRRHSGSTARIGS